MDEESAVLTDLLARVESLVRAHPPKTTEARDFLGARFDAGLAWLHFPPGHGGLGISPHLQAPMEAASAAAGAIPPAARENGIGLGMAAQTIVAFGTDEQKRRLLRPLWTGEHIYCQLFSKPGIRSRLGRDPGNPAWRGVARQWTEGLDLKRTPRADGHPVGAHRSGCPQARRAYLFRVRHDRSRR